MSEVDRLSNSGLYPALPIADKRRRQDGSGGQPPDGKPPGPSSGAKPREAEDAKQPRPPKSQIDEYA